MFRAIDITPFEKLTRPFQPGAVANQNWIEVKRLVVDVSYQRDIGKKGKANVRAIAEHFEWFKFAPVIVAPIEGDLFAIVDGQHRTTAAALRGIEKVPCLVILADREQQAKVFAAVNGSITRATGQQLYRARLAAGDREAVTIAEICEIAKVTLARTNKTNADLNIGETQAIGAMTRCLRRFGRETLITSLQCVTETSEGNAGFLRATIIESLCNVLNNRRDWRDAGGALLRAMDSFDYSKVWDEAMDGETTVFARNVRAHFEEKLTKHLERKLKTRVEASVVESPRPIGRRSEKLAA